MKKLVKAFGIILAMCLVFSFAACGVTGVYKAKSIEIKVGEQVTTFTADSTDEELGEFAYYKTLLEMEIEVTKDEIIFRTPKTNELGEKIEGEFDEDKTKYNKDGNKLIPLDKDGNPEGEEGGTLTLDGNKLIMEAKLSDKTVKVIYER